MKKTKATSKTKATKRAPKAPKAPAQEPTPTTALEAVPAPNETGIIIASRVIHTDTGLTFAPETTFDEWAKAHEFYTALQSRSNWWIGDSIIFGAEHFSDRYSQAVHCTGKEYSTLTTIVSVCERIPTPRRRASLPFSHHVEVAYIAPAIGDEILDKAEREGWSKMDVRNAVFEAQGKQPRTAAGEEKEKCTARAEAKPIVEGEFTPTAPTPTATEPTPDQAHPTEPPMTPEKEAETHLAAFVAMIDKLDVSAMRPLQKKAWLTKLIPIDKLIDALQTT